MFPLVLCPLSFEAVYCFICSRRRVAVVRYRMICFVLTVCNEESASNFCKTEAELCVANSPLENMLNVRRKFTITLMMVVLFYLISYVPFYIIIFNGVNNLDVCLYHSTSTLNGYLFIHWCYILNNVMNPIIYSMFDLCFERSWLKC